MQENVKTTQVAYEILLKCLVHGRQSFTFLFRSLEQSLLSKRRRTLLDIQNSNNHMFPSNALSQPTPKKLPKKLLSNLTKYLNELAFKIVEIVQSLYNFSTKGDRSILDRIINDLSIDDPDTILMLQTSSMIKKLVQSIKREDLLFIQFSEEGLISKRSQLVNIIGNNRENLKTTTSEKSTDVIKRTFKDLGVPLSKNGAVKRVSESLKQYFDSKAPFDFASEIELNNSFSNIKSRRHATLVLKSSERTLRKRTVNAIKVTSSSSSSSNPSARKRNRLVKLKVLPPPYPPTTDEAMPSPLKDTTTRQILFAAAGNNNMIIGGGGDVNKLEIIIT